MSGAGTEDHLEGLNKYSISTLLSSQHQCSKYTEHL